MPPPPATAARTTPNLADALDGRVDISAWVRTAAQEHGITATSQPIDTFASAASRLSDAEIHLDGVEQLLLALDRAGIVSGEVGVRLHATYLRQASLRQPSTRQKA